MFGFFINILAIFAETAAESHGGGALGWWYENVDPYMNYPGFEAWRFLNLIIFFSIMAYLLKKPLSSSFKAKREVIRAELIKAEEERKAAVAKLAEAEASLARVDTERNAVIEEAHAGADAEKARIEAEVASESKRLREQAEGEINRKAQQVKAKLRRFSAEESIRLAELKIRQAMSTETDSRLVKANIKSIGGMK